MKWVASTYDMSSQADEEFFALIYLHHIRNNIREVFGDGKISIFDAGCGQGRLSLPLAEDGHRLTGMDFTPQALETAKKRVAEKQLKIEFIHGDLEKDLANLRDRKYDCVIATEVLYMVRNYKSVIRELSSLLVPGGLFILSLRSRMYYTLHKLMRGEINEAYHILLKNENFINEGSLNCFSIDEIKEMMAENGIRLLNLTGIGVLSGIEGDPQALITRPSNLPQDERKLLFEMELSAGRAYPENGRYILVCGTKL